MNVPQLNLITEGAGPALMAAALMIFYLYIIFCLLFFTCVGLVFLYQSHTQWFTRKDAKANIDKASHIFHANKTRLIILKCPFLNLKTPSSMPE